LLNNHESTGYFGESNKKPAEAGFFKTILISCQKPPRQWSIIHDPEALPALQLMDVD